MSANKPATPAKVSQVTYNRAVKAARAAQTKTDAAAWIIGDAAGLVATEYGKNRIAEFSDDIGQEVATVRNFRTLAARYPVPAEGITTIARDLQHASVYMAFNRQDDAFDLIVNGNDGARWTVSAARALVTARNAANTITGDGDGEGNGNGESGTDERAKLVANVAQAELNLLNARNALDEYDAAHREVTRHTPAGMPAHDITDPQAACPDCKKAGIAPIVQSTPRKPSNRARREEVKANVAARNIAKQNVA